MVAIEVLLTSLGLGDTEQALYLAGLEARESGVSELVKKTGINRTTAYHALMTLNEKGFCSESKIGGKLAYVMTQPQDLARMLSRKQAALEAQKNELAALADQFPAPSAVDSQISVDRFDGVDGIKAAVDKALYCQNRKWRIIAPKSNFFSQMPREYARYFMDTRQERNIQSKSLWEHPTPESRKMDMHELLMRRPRYLRPELTGQFQATIIQFDDKLLFIHSLTQKSAVLITSREISRTFLIMFDSLWAGSTKPE